MTPKNLAKLLLIYFILFTAGTVLYVLSFRTPLFSNLDVFFYRGIAVILFWGIVISVGMYILRMKLRELITIRDILLLFVGFCSLHLLIFTHLPVTADRAVSVFMLGYMSDHEDESFSEEEMSAVFEEYYVEGFGAFSKRFHEQEVTGTIERDDGSDTYHITGSGKRLMRLYEKVADLYGLDDKLIHPDKRSSQ